MHALKEQLGNLLVEKKLLSPQQLDEVFGLYKKDGGLLSSLLTRESFVRKEALVDLINTTLNLATINASQLAQLKINPEVIKVISPVVARQYRIFPLLKEGQGLTLGLADPLTIIDLEDIKDLQDYTIDPVVVPEVELGRLIEEWYTKAPAVNKPANLNLEEVLSSIGDLSVRPTEEIQASELAQITQEVPIIKAINFILDRAIESRASDILIEPLEMHTRIRFRVDGMLHQVESLPKTFHTFIVSRIKVISNLDISEHRLPQDGQFQIKMKDRDIDFRVSVFPATTGEKVAIRIFDKSLGLSDIDKLGLNADKLERLKQAALMPNGMILVCGPTGSGKTSTLYSILKFINTPDKNIVTVEDPVEYHIKGINQVSVNIKTGLIFSRCLRSILRQDPDIIMIGEIRDFETVDIAIKSALTGHLVLSTLHTTTASGSVVRLIDMGVEPFLINASLICIIAQRLARRICLRCKEKVPSEPYFRGRGCKECLQTGYSGRVLISEVFYITPETKEAIASERFDEGQIRQLARSQGMKTLREEGEALAREGIITLEEVYRLTSSE